MMPGSNNALAPLTGLRGVAAYSVLLAHAIETFFVYQSGPAVFQPAAFRLAYFGMSLFFVLSGFVLFYTYATRIAAAPRGLGRASYDFFVARFARLYPLYVVALIVYSPHGLPHAFKHRPLVELSYATLTQSWFNVEDAFFPPDWSISTEWFFYFAFIPLSFLIVSLRRPTMALVGYCIVSLVAVFVVFWMLGPQLEAGVQRWIFADEAVSAPARWWLTYLDPPLRLLEFISGMLAANAFNALSARRDRPAILSLVMGVALTYCLFLLFFGGLAGVDALFKDIISNFAFAPALAAFLLGVCLTRGWLHRFLSTRPLMFMGEISYSVYMWSFLVLRLFPPAPLRADYAFRDMMPCLSDVLLDMALTTLLAYGSHHLIEAPARKWLRIALTAWRPAKNKLGVADHPIAPAPAQSAAPFGR
jgi:peptidoglycan/LPS O-acetylase OafA/YrhL